LTTDGKLAEANALLVDLALDAEVVGERSPILDSEAREMKRKIEEVRILVAEVRLELGYVRGRLE
jgi:hypothetical protein